MEKSALKEIVLSQEKQKRKEFMIERDIFQQVTETIHNPFVIIISGIRRVGKSTLLTQIKEKYEGHYLNFDDERLIHFTIDDFQVLYEVWLELYGEKEIFYMDEVQNVSGWERFVRRLHDSGKKVFVAGSNASMLSRELGTHLTGRYLEINLYPFSFQEFLRFKRIEYVPADVSLPEKKVMIKKLFDEYLVQGGLPEYLKTENKDYLKILYENVLYRDILVRYNLSNEKILKEMVYFIANNIAKEMTFNSLKKLLGLGSPTTVKEYFNYLEKSFFAFLVSKFEYSLKRQMYAPKKVYLIDTGIAVNLGFRVSKDLGRLLENIVFLELKRRKKEIFYESDGNECDFVLASNMKVEEAIQVCYELNQENQEREIKGLVTAMKKFKSKEGLILTHEQTEARVVDGKKIKVLPVYHWLLAKNQ